MDGRFLGNVINQIWHFLPKWYGSQGGCETLLDYAGKEVYTFVCCVKVCLHLVLIANVHGSRGVSQL